MLILDSEARILGRSAPLDSKPSAAAFQPRAGRLVVGLEDGRTLIYAPMR